MPPKILWTRKPLPSWRDARLSRLSRVRRLRELDEGTSSNRNMSARTTRRTHRATAHRLARRLAWSLAVLVLSVNCLAQPRASAGSVDDEVSLEKYAVRRIQPSY